MTAQNDIDVCERKLSIPESSKETKHAWPHLDGWRGCAVLLVLAGHFVPIPQIDIAQFGVGLFFALSGRLMADILFFKKMEISTFLKRRVARVFPALFVFATICFPIFYLASKKSELQNPFGFIDYLSAITFTTNYLQAFSMRVALFAHTWSLALEEHIYLLLAAISALTYRSKSWALAFLLLIALLMLTNGILEGRLTRLDEKQIWLRSDVRGMAILIGTAATLVLYRKHQNSVISPVCLLASFGFSFTVWDPAIRFGVSAFLLAVSVVSIDHCPWLSKILRNFILKFFGMISFSLYLWQQPVYVVIGHMRSSKLIIVPVAVLTVLVVACVSFWVIERPARRYLNRTWARA